MKLNRIILPLMACALQGEVGDDQRSGMEKLRRKYHSLRHSLALKEKIANYDYIKSYVAQYAPNMNVGLGLEPTYTSTMRHTEP